MTVPSSTPRVAKGDDETDRPFLRLSVGVNEPFHTEKLFTADLVAQPHVQP